MKFKTKITLANSLITLIAVATIYFVSVNTINFTLEQLKITLIFVAIIVPIALTIQYLASVKPFSIIEEYYDRAHKNTINAKFTKIAFYTAIYFPLSFMTVSAVQWYTASVIFFILLYAFAHAGATTALRVTFAIVSGATIANIFQYFVYQRLTEPVMRDIQKHIKEPDLKIRKKLGIFVKIFLSLFILFLLFLIFIKTISSKLTEDILRANGIASARIELATSTPAINSLLSQQLTQEQMAIELSKIKSGKSGYVLVMDKNYKDIFNISNNYANALPLDMLAGKDVYNDFTINSTLIKMPLNDNLYAVAVYMWSDYMPALSDFSESQNWLLLTMVILLTLVSFFIAVDMYLPVKAIASTVEKLTTGNFSTTSGLFVEDETGVVANSLRKMIDNIKSVIKMIKSASLNITEISDTMMNSIDFTKDNILILDKEVKTNAEIIVSVQNTLNQLTEYIDGLINSINETIINSANLAESVDSNKHIIAEIQTAVDTAVSSGNDLSALVTKIQHHRAGNASSDFLDSYGYLKTIDVNNEDNVHRIKNTIESIAGNVTRLNSEMTVNSHYRQKMGDTLYKITNTVSTLDENVNRIVADLNKIDLVIDDTNLLAMNSSVISAQAGESGRGFDVVSEEITKLANVTQTKILEVRSLTELLVKEKDTIMSNIKEKRKFIDAADDKFNLFESEISSIANKASDFKLEYENIIRGVTTLSSEIHKLSSDTVSGKDTQRIITTRLIHINKGITDINKQSKTLRHDIGQFTGEWSAYSENLIPISSTLSAIAEPANMINGYMKVIKNKILEIQGVLDHISSTSQQLNQQLTSLDIRTQVEKIVLTINEEPKRYRVI